MENNDKKSITDVINEYKNKNTEGNISNKSDLVPPDDLINKMNSETDPDLMTSYEIIDLPSKGVFYPNKLSKVEIEYMTSKDEDLLTTPSLIEDGRMLSILLKRKIKTPNVNPEDLLPGDRNAIILYLRTSSYGFDYTVEVTDPRNGSTFKEIIDLSKLKYKTIEEKPDQNGYFDFFLPMRKKNIKLRLLSSGEDLKIFNKSEEIKEAYGNEFSEYNTMKLKASIVSIEGNTDRNYIDRFVDAMPARDSLEIKRKIQNVQPDIDMRYEFVTKDGYKFEAYLNMGVDFFFPQN